MNNEKAIEKLMKHKDEVCRGCIHPQMMGWCEEHCMLPEALKMAIEALKNEINCVKCVHYTERETDTWIKGECKMDTAHSNANQDVQHVGSVGNVDLIDRLSALKGLNEYISEYVESRNVLKCAAMREAKKLIESLPSATCDDCIWHVCNYNKIDCDGEDGYISRRDAIKNAHFPTIDDAGYEIVRVDDIFGLPSVEPKREECEEREQGLCPFYAG